MYLNKEVSEFISVSLICSDPLNFRNDMEILSSLGYRKLHLDIMDSCFVPRFGLFPEISKMIHKEFDFEFDAHFMVMNFQKAIKEWSKYHLPNKISFHYKNNKNDLNDILSIIRDFGAEAIIAFDLDIENSEMLETIEKFSPDGVMLLGIKPGVLIQKHQPKKVLEKIKLIKRCIKTLRTIQVDGGVNFQTIPLLIKAGANNLVCGSSSVYSEVNFSQTEEKFKTLLQNTIKLSSLIRNV